MSSPIQVKRYDHMTIISKDLEATRHFYVDLLGMDEVDRPAFPFPGIWLQCGDISIHVTQESPEAGKAGWGDRGVVKISRCRADGGLQGRRWCGLRHSAEGNLQDR